MSEYAFTHPPRVSPGRVVVRARNLGRLPHELVMVILPEDVPPIGEQLRSPERRVVASLASLPARGPAREGTFAVDLAPGRYAFICFVADEDGGQHDQKGMSSELQVDGG
jgi:hypothetical protein